MSIRGLATGIGSLPFKDADQAVSFIFNHVPQIPFWPQLPKRDIREGMVAQFSENLPCIKISGDGIFWDDRESEHELERFYDRIIAGESIYFKISRDYAPGFYSFYERLKAIDRTQIEFIKCQITGPFTFAASINSKEGLPLLHDDVFMEVVVKGLAMKAQWQIEVLQEFDKKVILFIDEPYLSAFGSAFTPLSRERVITGLTELTAELKSEGALLGVHCCGNTDWSIFTDVKAIDIISFDAFGFIDTLVLYADQLKGFFKRGGILCWGAVPTQEYSDALKPEAAIKKIEAGINTLIKKGVDQDLVRNNLLLSPSCGLGSLDGAQAEKIFRFLSKISSSIRRG